VSLVERTVDGNNRPTFSYATALENLAEQLADGKCMPFLGAGACLDRGKDDLPTAAELSRELANDCRLEWHEYIPLSTIAFYYEFFYDRNRLNTFLTKRIGNPAIGPSTTMERLVEIVRCVEEHDVRLLVVTTNYDQHFEKAYQNAAGQRPEVIVYDGAHDPNDRQAKLHGGLDDPDYWDVTDRVALYKIHGCISDAPKGLVVTEEDYINFLTNALSHDPEKLLLHRVRGKIARETILFVGYSLADWNFRVIFKATAEGYQHRKEKKCYAVQYNPTPIDKMDGLEKARWNSLVDFWGKKNVDIIYVDAAQFMDDLLLVVRQKVEERALVTTD
jgi:hypothetical protein